MRARWSGWASDEAIIKIIYDTTYIKKIEKNTEAAINISETEPFMLLWSIARKL